MPEPDTPLTTVMRPTGIRHETPFRLWARAPRIVTRGSAATWGERWYGAGQNVQNMLYVRVGHGIVAGLVINGYVPDPGCIFRGVRKLPPGHLLTWERERGAEIRPYWSPFRPEDETLDEKSAVETAKSALNEVLGQPDAETDEIRVGLAYPWMAGFVRHVIAARQSGRHVEIRAVLGDGRRHGRGLAEQPLVVF